MSNCSQYIVNLQYFSNRLKESDEVGKTIGFTYARNHEFAGYMKERNAIVKEIEKAKKDLIECMQK